MYASNICCNDPHHVYMHQIKYHRHDVSWHYESGSNEYDIVFVFFVVVVVTSDDDDDASVVLVADVPAVDALAFTTDFAFVITGAVTIATLVVYACVCVCVRYAYGCICVCE